MSGERSARGLVDELIHQFTDPFAFWRELIQNSLDAGSARVEVGLRYQPDADGGLCLARVADWGEGMNRRLIEDYLVTKFRSTKENDLTKIGKFGIGFVSVFACAPDAVTVDTGRDGEFWRVLFRKDTTWELLQAHEPVEGTTVTLHKRMGPKDYADFVARSREAVRKWCRYSAADITFSAGPASGAAAPAPTPIREELAVDAPYQVELREDGSELVAGIARRAPTTGFYNRGLTLLENDEALAPGVSVRLVSRYLEHTLTRDDVRRDAHFRTALGLVRRLVDGPLLDALPLELEKAAARKDGLADWQVLFDYARPKLPAKALTLRATGGGTHTVAQVKEALADTRVLPVATASSPLVERMRVAGFPVLELALDDAPRLRAVEALVGAKGSAPADELYAYVEPPPVPREAFSAAMLEVLAKVGGRVSQVAVAEVRGGATEAPYVVVAGVGRPTLTVEAERSPFARGAPPLLVFNTAHPPVRAAVALVDAAPRLAAVLLARLLLVREGRLDAAADRAVTDWGLA